MLRHSPASFRLKGAIVVLVLVAVDPLCLWSEASAEPPPRLRAPRLSLSVAVPDMVMFGVVAGVLFANANDESKQDRNITLGVASAYTALFGMNLGWIVQAGVELNARLDNVDDRTSLRTPRIGTAFSVIDSAARASLLGTGIALIANPGEGLGAAGAVGAGITLLVVPPQNPVYGTIVDVCALGVKLAIALRTTCHRATHPSIHGGNRSGFIRVPRSRLHVSPPRPAHLSRADNVLRNDSRIGAAVQHF